MVKKQYCQASMFKQCPEPTVEEIRVGHPVLGYDYSLCAKHLAKYRKQEQQQKENAVNEV